VSNIRGGKRPKPKRKPARKLGRPPKYGVPMIPRAIRMSAEQWTWVESRGERGDVVRRLVDEAREKKP
jgi:hypothetical protein